MEEDHIKGLIDAIENDDDEAGKEHLAGLAYQVLSLLGRIADVVETLAARPTSS